MYPENAKVLAFLRRLEDETILVVVNLSRFAQAAEIDLSRFSGCSLMEMFSQNYFPPIKESPYPITLGPHAHYWFVLRSQPSAARASKERVVPTLNATPDLETLLADGQRSRFEREVLPEYIRHCRWFGAKARTIRELRIAEEVPVPGEGSAHFWFLEVTYADGAPETYALPVKIAIGEPAHAIAQAAPQAVIARFAGADEAILHDAIWDASFREQLFRVISAAPKPGREIR